jgi:hypothetical protein
VLEAATYQFQKWLEAQPEIAKPDGKPA